MRLQVTYKGDRAVADERSDWRDSGLSQRHRAWGYDCPCLDVDGLVVEYDRAEPKALIEYKHDAFAGTRGANREALARLGDRAGVPFLVVRYRREPWQFWVTPANKVAKRASTETHPMSERQFVTLLYRLGSRNLPADLARTLSDVEPQVAA